jgi:hypothetical protein
MTFSEVLLAFMEGLPITRKGWLEDDEHRIAFCDTTTKSFVDRRTAELWETQCKFLCFTYEDMDAADWEVCEWEDHIVDTNKKVNE